MSDTSDRPQSPGPNGSSGSPTGTTPPVARGHQRVGPYILGKTLGVGSTGRVKAAVHCETLQKVAIKIITKDATKEKENIKLEREITIMKLIKHPNILQIYDVYEASKELFLVLEQVEGGELFDYLIKRGRLSETEALFFFQQIIRGVEYCHRYMIWDLKPENLLLDKDLNVKVADFGMANLQVPTKLMETSCGSPHYASPEIIRGEKYDGPTSDVWSCGIILYALVTGNLPFADDNIRKLLSKVKTGIYSIPDHVSPLPRELIKLMLQVDPIARPTLKEVMQHPWYLSKPQRLEIKDEPSIFDISAFVDGYPNDTPLEKDLLDTLVLLGFNDLQGLIKALQSKGKNVEKAFYQLLQKRKYEMLESYDQDDNKYDSDGGPTRREASIDISTPTTSRQSSGIDNGPLSPGVKEAPKKDAVKKPSQVKYNSPLASETKAENEGKIEMQNSISETNGDANAVSPNPVPKAQPKVRKGLAINTSEMKKADDAPKSAVLQALNSFGTTAPPKHRKGQLLQESVPQSPVISNTPKTSWFQGMFNFKPETYYLNSSKDATETVILLEKILKDMNIEYESGGAGIIKCKADSALLPPSVVLPAASEDSGESKDSKTIKFKIELVPEVENNNSLRVQLVHKQGAFSIFQAIALGIKSSWV